jgi:hypothetical protein
MAWYATLVYFRPRMTASPGDDNGAMALPAQVICSEKP